MKISVPLVVVAAVVAAACAGCPRESSSSGTLANSPGQQDASNSRESLKTSQAAPTPNAQSRSRTLLTFNRDSFICVAYSADSSMVVAGAANRARQAISEIKVGVFKNGIVQQKMKIRDSRVSDVAFAPDGKSVVGAYALFGKPSGHIADIWDVRSGRLNRSLNGHLATGYKAFFMTDAGNNRRLLTRVGALPWTEIQPKWTNVQFSDATTGEILKSLRLPANGATPSTFCLSPNGKVLAMASLAPEGPDSAHRYQRLVEIFDTKSGQLLLSLPKEQQRECGIAISSDSHLLAAGRFDGSVQLWDIRNRKLLRTFVPSRAGVETVAFSPDGAYIACGGWDSPSISLWSTDTGKLAQSLGDNIGGSIAAGVTSIAFAPDGRSLLSGSTDGLVRAWDIH